MPNKKNRLLTILAAFLSASIVSVLTLNFLGVFKLEESKKKNYIVRFVTNCDATIPNQVVAHGEKVLKPQNPEYIGHTLKEWDSSSGVWDFSKDVVTNDTTLSANWVTNEYTITYELNGGTNSTENPLSYSIYSEFSFESPTKNNSYFLGWYNNDGTKIERISAGQTGNINLTAKWVSNVHVSINDSSKGSFEIHGAQTSDANYFEIEAISSHNKPHTFLGWYIDNILVTSSSSYQISLRSLEECYIEGNFMSDAEEQAWNSVHGVSPKMIESNLLTYGLYPQSVVLDEDLISILNGLKAASDGIVCYRSEYYKPCLVESLPSLSKPQTFNNGEEISVGQKYWFIFEPIIWRVLDDESETFFIMSEYLLDTYRFYRYSTNREIDGDIVYPNNYFYSGIRTWLNEDFLRVAFKHSDDNIIESLVDNSLPTTTDTNNKYCCENSNDKLFLLSVQEFTTTDYGFKNSKSSSSSRYFMTTEYSRAKGASYNTNDSQLYIGYSWTRSPYYDSATAVYRINKAGTINTDYVGWGSSCINPAMRIHF